MCSFVTRVAMRIMRIKFFILLLVCGKTLSAITFIQDSAFNPPVRNQFHSSILNLPSSGTRDSLSIRGNGLCHPFTSFPVLGDAMADVFRFGEAKHSILEYQNPNNQLQAELNFIAGFEPVIADENYSFLYKGFDLKAKIGQHWQMNTEWWNGMYFGDQTAASDAELLDGYFSWNGAKRNLDNLSGDLSYNARNLSLALGRGKFPIGNSISGSIIANDEVNDYAYVLAEGRSGAFSLSFMHSTLQSDSTYNIYLDPSLNSKNYPDKYFALHQLGYHPRANLNIFVGESVVYGNRSIDLNYILPNAFWRATEHNLWDRDNMLIFAGGTWSPWDPLFLYGQIALDEFSYGKLFTNWWGNKYAIQGGARYSFPFALPCSPQPDVTVELTAVRPFTYQHYMAHTMYSHDGRPLGYPKGSNLADVTALLRLPFSDWLQWQGSISYCKQGSFGSTYTQNYHDVFPGVLIQEGTATWFQGQKTQTSELKSSVLIDIFAHHRLLAGYKTKHTEAWDSELFAAWQFIY